MSAGLVGDVFRAIGEDNLAGDAVPIPVLGTGELAKVERRKCLAAGCAGGAGG